MENTLRQTNNYNPIILVPLVTSILLTTFLFYIDEGYYSLAWMLEPGAWIIFSIYVFIFFSFQFLLLSFFFKFLPNLFAGKLQIPTISIVSIVAIIIATAFAFYLFSNSN